MEEKAINQKAEKLNLPIEEKLKYDIEVWKVAIDTQMHFNELLIKMRTTVISIILAVFGGAVIALRDMKSQAQVFGLKVHISIVVIVIGLVFLFAQFILDCFYYFRLLLGAVHFSEKLDQDYEKHGLFGLTTSITKSVPRLYAGVILCLYYLVPFILGIFAIWVIQCKLIVQ